MACFELLLPYSTSRLSLINKEFGESSVSASISSCGALISSLILYESNVNGSDSVTSPRACVLLILSRLTPPSSYLNTGVPAGYVFGLSPLTISPPMVLPVTLVYSIISFPIMILPTLVVPTPTFSNVPNVAPAATKIPSVESAGYATERVVGLISGVIPEIFHRVLVIIHSMVLVVNVHVQTIVNSNEGSDLNISTNSSRKPLINVLS